MKKVKGLSIVMSAMLAVQGGMNPAVFATNSKKEMNEKIQNQFLQTIFFRQDLIGKLKQFLPNNMKEEEIPKSLRTPGFLKLLRDNGILEDGSKEERKEEFEEEKAEGEWSPQKYMNYIKQIIEEDNLELLQKEVEKDNFMNTRIEDSFFEVKDMQISILHYCVIKKAIKCFKFLLLNGANPLAALGGYSAYKDWDCMSVAICFGEWEMMKILEERGMNKLTNSNAWEAAALTHRNNLLKLFIGKKDEINNDVLFQECLDKAMFGAVKGNNIKGFIRLLSEGADINAKDKDGRTPLDTAAERDAVKVAELLISKGADINAKDARGETPLHVAVRLNNFKMVELLISKGADINAKDSLKRLPLYYAAWRDAVKVAELLISKGADVNVKDEYGGTPLYFAAVTNANKVADLLVNKGADINTKDKDGEIPLQVAARHNADKVAELLISKGVDINVRNQYGRTPLHIAVENDALKVAELLIEKGADINAKDEFGVTPLHCAAWWMDVNNKLAELLISKGADINAKDKHGSTPLYYAAKFSAPRVAGMLISKGADINAKDEYGLTPLQVCGDKVIEHLLKSKGAK